MKTGTLILLGTVLWLLTRATGAWGQEYASYYQGHKVYYAPSTELLLVQFATPQALARRSQSPASLGARAFRSLPMLPGVAVLEVEAGKTKAEVQQLAARLTRDADVAHAAPVLLNSSGKPFGGATDQFIVHLNLLLPGPLCANC